MELGILSELRKENLKLEAKVKQQKEMTPEDIINIIKESFAGSIHIYTEGSCYKFYLILKKLFKNAEPYYYNYHVVSKINNKFWDITGQINGELYKPYDYKIGTAHLTKFSLWDCGLECPNCDEIVIYNFKSKE